jgi:hypothetical protein
MSRVPPSSRTASAFRRAAAPLADNPVDKLRNALDNPGQLGRRARAASSYPGFSRLAQALSQALSTALSRPQLPVRPGFFELIPSFDASLLIATTKRI